DRGFVDAGDPLDDFAIGRDDVSGFANDEMIPLQLTGGDLLLTSIPAEAARYDLTARLAEALCLRLAVPLRHCLGKVCEKDGKPEPDRELHSKLPGLAGEENGGGHYGRTDLRDEHYGVLRQQAGVEFAERAF